MSLRMLSAFIGLVLIFAMLPNVMAQENHPRYRVYPDHYFNESIWLFLYVDYPDTSPSLIFSTNYEYLYDYSYYYEEDYWDGTIEIGPNESLTLSISGVTGRVYNPNIDIELYLDWDHYWNSNVTIDIQLRCDGDGDGNLEYIANFPDSYYYWGQEPSSEIGKPIDMTDGTIEVVISRTDDSSSTGYIYCDKYSSYIQVPFDYDTDTDGIGDYSDSDDDGDGHDDRDDEFPYNPKEWKDTDGDGIGDNADEDNNGNGIPDDLEIPLALGIMLIPFVVIAAIMRHMRRKSGGKGEKEEIKPITSHKSGPKNW